VTFTTHEHIVGPIDLDAGVRRRPEAGLAEARAPWRKVASVEKLRAGWAIFLECPGHVMFVDSLKSPPKKMRCMTCAGRAHPAYYLRRKPRDEDLRAVLSGREHELPAHRVAAANRRVEDLGAAFAERIRRYGPSAVAAAVAEACGRSRRRP
jgi:hypothetical protein